MVVYLIDCRPLSVLKIGYSNDPQKRRKELGDSPIPLGELQELETTGYGDAKTLEQLLHRWYWAYQSPENGKEYFDLPSEIRARLAQRFSVPDSVIPGYWFFLLGNPASYLRETNSESAWWDAQPWQKEQLIRYLDQDYSAADISDELAVPATESVISLGLELLSSTEEETADSNVESSQSRRPVGQQRLAAFVDSEPAATRASTTWKDVEELQQLIHDEGLTYKEIANRSDGDVTPDRIGRYAREHDVNPGRRKYTGNEVTVYIDSDGRVSIPIPEQLTHELQLAEEVKPQENQYRMQGKIVGYYIGIDNGKVNLYLDARHERGERQFSNERTIAHNPGHRHVLARPPKVVSDILELDKTCTEQSQNGTGEGKQSLRDVTLETIDEGILKMDFSPAVEPVEPETPARPIWDDDGSLEIQVETTSLYPIGPSGAAETGKGIEKYSLCIPMDYHRRYDLTDDSEVGVSLAALDGKPSILFHIDSPRQASRVTRSIQTSPTIFKQEQTNGDSKTVEKTRYEDQRFLYPPLPLIHAIGMRSKHPEVTLIPGEDWFAIQPAAKNPKIWFENGMR